MEIHVRIEDLKKINLTLTQYLVLWALYNKVEIVTYLIIDEKAIEDLKKRAFIFDKEDGIRILTSLGLEVFEPQSIFFDEFIKVFPTRVKNQAGMVRALSPASSSSLSGKKMKRKWCSITKNDVKAQEHILNCLKEEVELRRKENNLYYMRNMETWLNKATWEDYEYLLEESTKENKGFRVNEILL
jgi:hypothetical protein